MRLREWLRAWLFREETSNLKTLMFQADNLRETAQLGIEQSAQILEDLEKLHALIGPQAPRVRAGRAPVLDWDEVQRQGLREFEDRKKGDRG